MGLKKNIKQCSILGIKKMKNSTFNDLKPLKWNVQSVFKKWTLWHLFFKNSHRTNVVFLHVCPPTIGTIWGSTLKNIKFCEP